MMVCSKQPLQSMKTRLLLLAAALLCGWLTQGAVNDDFANAITLTGRSASNTSDYANATLEVAEQKIASYAKGQTLWWRWTAPETCLVHLDLTGPVSNASDLYTVLGVYEGDALPTLRRVTFNLNSTVWGGSHCDFLAVAGVTYHFVGDLYVHESRVGGVRIDLEVESLPPLGSRPFNDDFGNATLLAGKTAVGSISNENATGENGEPRSNGGVNAKSVWWRWVAPTDGFLRISTAGSTVVSGAEMDTVLAAYSGSALPNLYQEGLNDDSGSRLTSEVTIAVNAGRNYWIAVMTAPGSASGTARVELELMDTAPAPDWSARDLTDRIVHSGEYSGQVVVLNIWATWCGPCRQEIPDLISLHERYKHSGLAVIGISVDSPVGGQSPLSLVRDFVSQNAISYPVLLDRPWGTVEERFGSAPSIPTSYIIDRQGKIVSTLVGAFPAGQNLARFERAVLPLLAVPTLGSALLADGRIELSWDEALSAKLEARTSLSATWQTETATPVVRNGRRTVTLPANGAARFFRLVVQ